MAEVGVTKQVLAYSMKDLMSRQPLAKITVGDVCQACGMNRKSFYYHFQDKYDLVTWIFHGDLAVEAEGAMTLSDHLTALCRTVEKNVPFYRAALKDGGQNSLQECIAQELRAPAEREIAALVSDAKSVKSVTDLFVAICCFSLVRWVQDGCTASTEEFIGTLHQAARVAGIIATGH